MLKVQTIAVFIFSGFLLCIGACTSSPVDQPELGPISATGTLIPAELSLLRRGTHVFLINGEKKYYVESKTENLIQSEGQIVHIDGIAEENTSKDDLPVLIVRKVTSVRGESGLHVWNIPALDLQIQTPNSWSGSIQKNVVTFHLSNEETALLTLRMSETGSLPSLGNHYYLGGHRAVRNTNGEASGVSDVYIENKASILQVHFDISAQKFIKQTEDSKLLTSEFEYSMNSIKFLSDRTETLPGSGSSVSLPCGGEANIVCPKESFCDVSDPVLKIGKCRPFSS